MKKRSLKQRLRTKRLAQGSAVAGVAWYSEDQWALVRATATDAERFESSYSEWLTMAKDALRNLQAAGITPVRVLVMASELSAWCIAHGKPNDAGARAQFASEKMGSRSDAEV
jgi:hypothetical protein